MQLQYIDHYDSFSYNVVDWLQSADNDVKIEHYQYDEAGLLAKIVASGSPVVLSPGPKSPQDVTQTLEIAEALIGRVPVLGICLGHQILGHLAGYALSRCAAPRHGTTEVIRFAEESCFYQADFPKITAALYNSLCLSNSSNVKAGWSVTGRSERGEIHVIENWKNPLAPAIGIQFHPESFLTENSHRIRDCWYRIINQWVTTNLQSLPY